MNETVKSFSPKIYLLGADVKIRKTIYQGISEMFGCFVIKEVVGEPST